MQWESTYRAQDIINMATTIMEKILPSFSTLLLQFLEHPFDNQHLVKFQGTRSELQNFLKTSSKIEREIINEILGPSKRQGASIYYIILNIQSYVVTLEGTYGVLEGYQGGGNHETNIYINTKRIYPLSYEKSPWMVGYYDTKTKHDPFKVWNMKNLIDRVKEKASEFNDVT